MDAFYGEIRAFPYNFIPMGWYPCDGRQMSVVQFQILYSIIGNTYGGNSTAFNLPDLRGFVPIGAGVFQGTTTYQTGQPTGQPTVTLTQNQIPSHNHPLWAQSATSRVTAPSSAGIPASPMYVVNGTNYFYRSYVPATASPAPTVQPMASTTVGQSGGGLPHDNHSPYLVMWYCINVESPDSIYPVRN